MFEEKISQEFRLKNIDETRNYFIKEISQNELMSKKNKKVSRVLNYIKYLLILISTVSGCVPIPAFASLFGIPNNNWQFPVKTKGIKKYELIIKKN